MDYLTPTTSSLRRLALSSFCALAAAACSTDAGDQLTSAQAQMLRRHVRVAWIATATVRSVEWLLGGTDPDDPAGVLDVATGSDVVASRVADAADAFLESPACLVTSRDGDVLTHTFDDCVGPRGRHLTGMVTTTVSRTDGCIAVRHVSAQLRVDGSPRALDARREYCADGTFRRSLATSGIGPATEPFDVTLSQSGRYDAAADCFTRSSNATVGLGAWQGTRMDTDVLACWRTPSDGALRREPLARVPIAGRTSASDDTASVSSSVDSTNAAAQLVEAEAEISEAEGEPRELPEDDYYYWP